MRPGCSGRRGWTANSASLRAELDRLGPGTAAARAAAGELALRAASALMTTKGSRSLLVTEHGQRLAREAMFILVYALRPASRAALLARLGAPERSVGEKQGDSMDLGLNGSRVLITGGSRGIGLAIAEALAAKGAAIGLVARGADGLAAAADRLSPAGARR